MADDNLYKADLTQINHGIQLRAAELVQEIEKKCDVNAFAFIKNNSENKKIRHRLHEPHFYELLGVLMTKLISLSLIKGDVDDFTKADISKAIRNRFSDLTLEQIWMYFQIDRHGENPPRIEHYNAFSAQYVSDVLAKGKAWEQTTKQQHNIAIIPAKTDSNTLEEITPEAADLIVKEGIVRRFEQFKKKEKIELPIIQSVAYLWEKKLFPADCPFEMLYNIAKRDLTTELKVGSSPDKIERIKIKEAIADLETEKFDKDGNPISNGKVLARAKLYTLDWFFKKLIDSKKDITDILK